MSNEPPPHRKRGLPTIVLPRSAISQQFAAAIVADSGRLCDRAADGMEIPAVMDAVDRLHMTAAAAARELAAVVKDFEDWTPVGEITCGPRSPGFS